MSATNQADSPLPQEPPQGHREPVRVYLSLGSNLGDRRAYLKSALDSLPDLVAHSQLYETDPVGGPEQGAYLNLVAELHTALSPEQLLGICHRVESASDRVRDVRWGARTLDIDILWMDGVELDSPRLTIPHPRWKERRFVLAPLRELAPDLVTEQELNLSEGTVRLVDPL
ncbi:MAG: 2-amino-4-hydroxy-6-hydroxymethyldihydropteridine diphosphokinase [Microthrixaceae bacterium]